MRGGSAANRDRHRSGSELWSFLIRIERRSAPAVMAKPRDADMSEVKVFSNGPSDRFIFDRFLTRRKADALNLTLKSQSDLRNKCYVQRRLRNGESK